VESFNKEKVLHILTPDFIDVHSVLNIIVQFWSTRQQAAFKACYGTMRFLDDLVDDLKEANGGMVPAEQQLALRQQITTWLTCLRNGQPWDQHQQELLAIMKEFKIPIWPWEKLAAAMVYDMDHNGFATFKDFLQYAEGAAVAPGAVAMHLGGLRFSDNEYQVPSYDIGEYARPLSLFSYLVHIIRDFQKDQLNDLNYFADDLMKQQKLDRLSLRAMAEKGIATPSLRKLIGFYYHRAENYRLHSRTILKQAARNMEQRYLLSLEVLFGLYCQVFDRINLDTGNFTTEELNPTPQQMFDQIKKIVTSFTM